MKLSKNELRDLNYQKYWAKRANTDYLHVQLDRITSFINCLPTALGFVDYSKYTLQRMRWVAMLHQKAIQDVIDDRQDEKNRK